jgi:2,5-furandicarboxylate decarboxylase 1
LPFANAGVDFDRFRLRTFLDALDAHGELLRYREPVALGEVAMILESTPQAVLFERVGSEGLPLAGNVIGSRRRLALAFGVELESLLPEALRRLNGRPEVVEVSRSVAPVQEIVLRDSDAAITALPVHLQHELDGGPYISAAIDFTVDEEGNRNVGVRRLMLRGRFEAGINISSNADLPTLYRRAAARGETLPVSIVVGSHPVDHFGATMKVPGDELALLSTLRDGPMPVVKSITSDILVPADAEWVIEGHIGNGYTEAEGPFGEYAGYYGSVMMNPVLHVTAITRRHDAVFQTLSIAGKAMHRTDTAQLTALRTEILSWRSLQNAVREPHAIYAPPATGGSYTVRAAIRPRFAGEAKNAIAAIFSSMANVKNVFIVDPDIDVFSDEQIEWALATRCNPARDVLVIDGMRASPIDPALDHPGDATSKVGFDLTRTFGTTGELESTFPHPPRYEGPRFASLDAALLDGPKTFGELMAALNSRDGREIVLLLEEMRIDGRVARERETGRYLSTAPSAAKIGNN